MIYCGRPYELSTPPSLLDETLCKLRHDATTIQPTAADIQCYQSLCALADTFEDEAARREEFSRILTEGGILPAWPLRAAVGPHYEGPRYETDGDLRVVCLGKPVIYYLQEIKREIAGSTADPYVEAIRYWIESVRDILRAHPEHHEAYQWINFPAIIVLHFGQSSLC